MNSLNPPEKDLNLHVLLEQTETGRSIAAIAEISGFQVEADTREEALMALQQLLKQRLTKMEIVPLSLSLESPVRENPWTEFIGMFEGDAEFAELAKELRAEREMDVSDVA
jgi:hypothetical protein